VKFERESDNIGKAMTDEQEAGLLARCEDNLLLQSFSRWTRRSERRNFARCAGNRLIWLHAR